MVVSTWTGYPSTAQRIVSSPPSPARKRATSWAVTQRCVRVASETTHVADVTPLAVRVVRLGRTSDRQLVTVPSSNVSMVVS